MVKLMTDYATELGVNFQFRTPVKKILTGDKGQALGVIAVDENGEEVECLADAVIVGTGGMGNNVDMIKEYMGWTWGKDMFTFRIPGIDGDGMNMVWDIGGKKDKVSMEVTYNTPGTTDIFKTLSEAMRQPSCIMVNIEGERIINEEIMENTTFTGNAICQQTGMRTFSIIGQDGIDYMKEHGLDYITYHHGIKDLDKWESEKKSYLAGEHIEETGLASLHENLEGVAEAQKNFWECSSIEEVAEVTGINYETLKKTIERYNSFAGGYDEDFVKAPRYLRPITGDKFYVARHFPSGYGSLGGIKVNHNMQILNTENKPIPGLYGCGTDTAGVFAGEYCFYNPGSTMSYALNSGRIAGMEAWDYIESDDFVV
jgi:fumarate reductase flavoprotein subunit